MEWFRLIIGPDEGNASAAQFCARAVILLILGIFCIRVAGRRTFSNLSPLDILVMLVIGSNISRAMTGKAPFVETTIATFAFALLHRLLAMATVRSNLLALFVKGRPAILVREGLVDPRAMYRHHISQDDLLEALRMEQTASLADVRLATIERGGKISVVRV